MLLVGMMGVGKSTVGRLLSGRLGWRYVDSDEEVERRAGRTIAEIWQADGEAAFRAEEARVLATILASSDPTVVAMGGGTVGPAANRALIRESGALVVWIRASVEVLVDRLGDGAGRPLLGGDPAEAIARLDAERRPIYGGLADVIVDGDGLAPSDIAARIAGEVATRSR